MSEEEERGVTPSARDKRNPGDQQQQSDQKRNRRQQVGTRTAGKREARKLEGKSIQNFLRGFNSEATKESYYKKLGQFLDFHSNIQPDVFLQNAKADPKFAEHAILDYVEARRKEVSGSTFRQTRDSLKHFFEMNDLDNGINWEKISKLIPRSRKVGTDRAPTIDEARSIVENCDIRTKCIVLITSSSGIRVGAFDYLAWGNIKAITTARSSSKVLAARMVVYRGEPEEYVTFITPEAYEALLEYKMRREAIGEAITSSSPLIRDAWDSNEYRKYKRQNRAEARGLSSKAIANQMGVLLKKIGVRGPPQEERTGKTTTGKIHYDFKQIHGFRKFFETNAGRGLKPLDVKSLMGTRYNYYKPEERYLLAEYLKVVKYLTISEAAELKEKLEKNITVSNKKVGELERENVQLQDRLGRIEENYDELKKMIEARVAANISSGTPSSRSPPFSRSRQSS